MINKEFVKIVKEKLQEMTMEQKDAWILEIATMLEDSKQMEYMMSLGGIRKIMYMPTIEKIDEFVNKVNNGEIYIEERSEESGLNFEKEFFYDYDILYEDPFNVFPFLNRIFYGCHDLICLKYYQQAYEILNKVCQAKFKVKFFIDNEYIYDEILTIEMICCVDMLSVNHDEIGYDWIMSYLYSKTNDDCINDLMRILENSLCYNIYISDFKDQLSKDTIIQAKNILIDTIHELNDKLDKYKKKGNIDIEYYTIPNKLERKVNLLEDIEQKCL